MGPSWTNLLGPVTTVTIIYFIICFCGVQATHFRGGTISWKPSDSFSISHREVIFTFRLGWRLSRIECDDDIISTGFLVGEDARWFCMFGCEGVLSTTRTKCTEFNLGDDWMIGINSFKHVFDSDGPIEISYTECCWLTDLVMGAGGEWALTTTLNLGIRSDIGRPNSSPVTTVAPLITLRAGVSDIIDLAVRDTDGDIVRCRLGRHVGECGTICPLFSEFSLDEENCLIRYHPVSNTTGKIPVAVMVEDFHISNGGITMGRKSFGMTDPLSAVPVQFLVVLEPPPANCSAKPTIELSVPTSIPIKVRPGRKFQFTASAVPCDLTTRIEEFILIAPLGVRRSPIMLTEDVYTTDITWTPEPDQDGSNAVCITARSSNGVLSEKKCVTVEVPKATASCSIVGGSQFITFDDHRYDFLGKCEYKLAQTLDSSKTELTPFEVTVSNGEFSAGSSDTRIGTVTIKVMDQVVVIDRRRNVMLNEIAVNVPVRLKSGLRVEKSGRGLAVSLSVALRVYLDDKTLTIQLPRDYMNQVEGLCGNYNDDDADDFSINGGESIATDVTEFASSYVIYEEYDPEGCSREPNGVRKTECIVTDDMEKKCQIIKAEDGCFANCHDFIDPKNFYDNCISALCKAGDDFTLLDVRIRSYADACQREAITVCDWRELTNIALECAPYSHYESCARIVAPTCADTDSNINPHPSDSCIEGCVCDTGYILSGSVCVPESECGCIISGNYYPKGFTYRNEDCSQECVCGQECFSADPCNKRARCEKGTDGFYRCIEEPSKMATCTALTDPHYETFDGTKFDSMGSCAYIMVRSKRNSTLTSFTVVSVNEQPNNTANASQVKEVHIHFGDDHTLSLLRGPRIILDDKEINTGSNVYGVEIRQVGKFVAADFNFGLVVRWDGIDRLRITAWPALRFMVEGLCGDYDDNPKNDFAVRPTEENLPDAYSFAQSWRISGYGTKGCRDYPGIEIPKPTCKNDATLAKYQKDCRGLIDPNGPFSDCHEFISPWKPFSDCVYDLCSTHGDMGFKERVFASYGDDCIEETGVSRKWRDTENLVEECKDGTFSECLEPCQPTCTDQDASICLSKSPQQLGATCVEGCECSPGLVLSGGECVKPEDCGCVIDGRYVKKGFTFATGNCTETCVCLGKEEMDCSPTPFGCEKNRDTCRIRADGYFECFQRLRRRATCKAVTDPHYMTFDRKTFDSMGTCAYIMVQSRSTSTLTPFKVVAVNEQPVAGRNVSHVKEAWVHVGDNFNLSFTDGGVVSINGRTVIPGTIVSGIVEVRRVGRFIVADFDFGLVVKWDGKDRLRISAWARLRGHLEGICGDFDDDDSNDFMTPEGELVESIPDFVNSWQIDGYDSDGCREALNDPPDVTKLTPCSDNATYDKRRRECSELIMDPDGDFAECVKTISPAQYIEDCTFDLCTYDGDKQYKERVLSEYQERCKSANISVPDNWRDEPSLTHNCSANSHPESCLEQCQPTCTDRDASVCINANTLGEECVSGCKCDEGFVLSGNDCVEEERCGCVLEDGSYVQQGFSWRTKDCTQDCQCTSDGQVTCTAAENCKVGFRCRLDKDGYKRCIPHVKRRATCKAVTDPHYRTFDGVNYDSMGTCAYIMTKSKEGADVTPFRVVAVNEQPQPDQNVSHVKEVFIHVRDDITVRFQEGGVVTINGEVVNPGSTVSEIEVRKVGRFTVAQFPFGLVIRWDGLDRLRVSAWGVLKGKMEGLCGDFNEDPDNDFMTPDGNIETNLVEFVNSWKVDGYDTEGCFNPEIFSPCDKDPAKLQQYREDCKILIDSEGGLLSCQEVTDPTSAFNNCVFDACAYSGDVEIRERLISSYVEDCREDAEPGRLITIPDENRTVECFGNAHFESCIDQCQPTCSDQDASKCKASSDLGDHCVEGCKCDDGFILSGSECVRLAECGCEVNGRYIAKGQSYSNRNCTRECTCIGKDEISCDTKEGCGVGFRCRYNGEGRRACIPHVRRRATCKAVTDPHYQTFDGINFDSMGTCAYMMARSKEGADVPAFSVVAVNEQSLPQHNVSSVKEVYVYLGDDVTIAFKRGSVVTINQEVVNPGTHILGIQIRKVGRFVVAELPFGLVIRWDGIDRLRISAWGRLKGMMEGLCGDFDDNPENDFMTPEGNIETNLIDFVNSWKVDGYDTENCFNPEISSPCDRDPAQLEKHRESCRVLIDSEGGLLSCQEVTDPTSAFNNCVFDACAYSGDEAIRQRLISSYIEDCREDENPGDLTWIPDENRTVECFDNQHFESCIDQCQPTCSDPDASECRNSSLLGENCVEGCKCDDGYILSADACVPLEQCGCKAEGRYIAKGERYMNRNCTSECTCLGEGNLECTTSPGCAAGFRCRFNGKGKRACIPHVRRRATCSAVTDPHYMTFDKKRYDSMGTCAYTMVRAKDGTDLPKFRIININERPDPDKIVSHVKEVVVEMGKDFVMSMTAGPVVRINGEVILPGSTVDKVAIRRVGRFTVAEFPFGLVLKWDGIDRLRVSAWGRLKGKLEGLCGDFDDDPTNDFTTPSGRQEESIEKFVRSWKVFQYSPEECFDSSANVTDCVNIDVYREECSELTNPEGSYAECHKSIDPRPYFENCVFDMCWMGGDEDTKLRNIHEYTEACLVDPKNTPENITEICPENTVSSVGMSQCQNTCSDPDGSICRSSTILGDNGVSACKCVDGMVLSGDNCVLLEECGCVIDEKYREKGFKYMTSQCDEICECYGPGNVTCTATEPCRRGERCGKNSEQQYGCLPIIRQEATCKAITDPHFSTYDGRTFDSSATCAYIMTRSRPDTDATAFRVVTVHEPSDNDRVSSSVKEVHVEVGEDFKMVLVRSRDVKVNGVDYKHGSTISGATIRKIGLFTVVDFPFGLVVRWDGKNRLRITVWGDLRNQVEGICGNFNDDASDDLTMSDGIVTDDVDEFVESWKARGYNAWKCVNSQDQTDNECTDLAVMNRYREECSILTDASGPFGICHFIIPPGPAFEACVSDLCRMGGLMGYKESILASYMHDCYELSEVPGAWRASNDLPLVCPANSRYVKCMHQCQPTCGDLDATICKKTSPFLLGSYCVEGCKCNTGFYLSDKKCVPIEKCGCLVGGIYYTKGFKYKTTDCAQECECKGNNSFECRDFRGCLETEVCKKVHGGYFQCARGQRRRATCKAITDPHYTTFDQKTYDSQGVCSYTMVRSKSDALVEPFTLVTVNEQPLPNTTVSHVKEVHLDFKGNNRLSFFKGPVATLNGEVILPGSNLDGMKVLKVGRFLTVIVDFGITIRWDGNDRLRIIAWGNLRGQIEGMCGDFNDDPSDDFVHGATGDILTDVDEFVNSWRAQGYNDGCQDIAADALSATPTFTCVESKRGYYEGKCSFITDPNGPLKECHNLMDAEAVFRDCVMDSCAYGGDEHIKERVVSDFAELCRENGGVLKPDWREEAKLVDVECPENSHFVTCMSQCQPTCDDIDGSECASNLDLGNSCVEGCQANKGFVISGDSIVPPSECGCKKDGRYYMNKETFYTEGCATLCQCIGGTVTCNVTRCERDQECMISDAGKLGCVHVETTTCTAWGNTHVTSFDGRHFSVDTNCNYMFAQKELERGSRVESFFITFSLAPDFTNPKIANIRNVRIRLPQKGIGLLLRPDAQARVSGSVVRNWRKESEEGKWVAIDRRGTYIVLTTHFGLTVAYDGHQVRVTIPNQYAEKTQGLCGNYNGDASDDLRLKDGSVTDDANVFAKEHLISSTCKSTPNVAVCSRAENKKWSAIDKCGAITDVNGEFANCSSKLNAAAYKRTCIHDMCLSGGTDLVLARFLKSYAHECMAINQPVCDWRRDYMLQIACPVNSHYRGCAEACESTCGVPEVADCRYQQVEDCVCDSGYIRFKGACIPEANCGGCLVNKRLVAKDFTYRRNDCGETCLCLGNNNIECQSSDPCMTRAKCGKDADGFQQCLVNPRTRATCQVFGNAHFVTFDGAQFDSSATCSMVMARTRPEATVPEFSVKVFMQPARINSDLSRVVEIIVTSEGLDFIMAQGRMVLVNGRKVALGSDLDMVTVRRMGRDVVAIFKFGLTLRWDGKENLRIEAWKNLQNQVEGLCGNFDEDERNDFRTITGVLETDTAAFVNSWGQASTQKGCRLAKQINSPCQNKEERAEYQEECDKMYSPDDDLVGKCDLNQLCVREMCAKAGDKKSVTTSVNFFAEECFEEYSEEIILPTLPYLQTITCPANSHFNPCMEQCQNTCSDPEASTCKGIESLSDKCIRGCECDDGYVLDRDQCVKQSECGCVGLNGEYYQNGFDSYLEDCESTCQCDKGDLTCEKTQCFQDQYCGDKKGKYGCHWEDECNYDNGGCDHLCLWRGKKVVCSCRPGYELSADNRTCTGGEDPACADSMSGLDIPKWKQETMEVWIKKLDTYLLATKKGVESGEPTYACNPVWTKWLDADDPDGKGDNESLKLLRKRYPGEICENPVAIEAQLEDGRNAMASGKILNVFDAQHGLKCLNAEQRKGEKCSDFQVRFLCLEELI